MRIMERTGGGTTGKEVRQDEPKHQLKKGGSEAAKELGRALVEDKSSALSGTSSLVPGQLQHVDGLDFLVQSLERDGEHEFASHESTEADGDWDMQDHDLIVRQSCEVALDAMDFVDNY
ncbi:hypothetical protein TeGR_g8092 [Tetraparma gracilis]|uniref:Uncharacterized protein n=1 Tax=Tetraparma gracilis TaxID=2962635 RepID=A0ABQ6N5C3_9STRA|nr:hypothetical protein TeGR_g8092 [Tetraparma gracilis]